MYSLYFFHLQMLTQIFLILPHSKLDKIFQLTFMLLSNSFSCTPLPKTSVSYSVCQTNKFPSNTDAAGLQTKLWQVDSLKHNTGSRSESPVTSFLGYQHGQQSSRKPQRTQQNLDSILIIPSQLGPVQSDTSV